MEKDMSEEVELTFLRHLPQEGRFHFKTKPHPRFDQLLTDMVRKGLFAIRTVIFFPGSGYTSIGDCYSISEDGMWFLRPHFANYEEMLKKEQSPYELFEEGQEHTDRESRTCIHCHFAYPSGLTSQLCQCEYCHLPVCLLCRRAHVNAKHVEEILRTYRGSPYSFTWRVDPDITAEGVEGIFRQFFASGPYARAQAARNATPKLLSRETQAAFALLDIPCTSSADEIKRAFRAKALVTHPDHGGDQQEMIKLNKAKEVALTYVER